MISSSSNSTKVFRSKITAIGSYLPKNIVTNDDLSKMIDTSDEWIFQRTGIKQRHISADNELTSDLATAAAQDCFQRFKIDPKSIDMVIVATTTPDLTFPATAARVQSRLGLNKGITAFDLQAVCSGFVYSLSVADQFIRSGVKKNVLIIGAETFSRILDWQDRSTCVLFGDGAGAIVLSAYEPTEEEIKSNTFAGLYSSHLYSDGDCVDILCANGGPSANRGMGITTMQGKEVFKVAVRVVPQAIEEAVTANGFKIEDIGLFVIHQANQRILDAIAQKLGISERKMISTVSHHANTSAASVPLALDFAYKNNMLKEGELVALAAMGAGMTWASALLRWHEL